MALQEKIACAFCRNKYSPFNVPKHEAQCAMNPINGDKLTAPVTFENQYDPEEVGTIQPHPDPHSLITSTKIRNVMQLQNSGLSAIFHSEDESETIVPISFMGTIIAGEDELPSLLIVDGYGFLKAPSSLIGFQGVVKNDQLESFNPEEQEEVFVEEPEPEIVSKPEQPAMTQDNTINEMIARIKEVKPT